VDCDINYAAVNAKPRTTPLEESVLMNCYVDESSSRQIMTVPKALKKLALLTPIIWGPKRCSRELLDVIRLHESLQFVEIHHQPGNKYKLDFNDLEHFAHLHTIINENETRSRVPGGDATNTDQM
jgi:hypothetical protein